MEQWLDIPGYEGLYQASNMGNIRTCEGKTTYTARHGDRHWKQRVLKQKFNKNKYGRTDARVCLWKDGKAKTWLVARLVGLAWCAGYADEMTINHINGNTLDNRAENLEWVKLSENIKKGYETGLFASLQIPIMLKCCESEFSFASMAEAGRFLGRNNGYVHNCLRCNRPIKDADGNVYRIYFLKEV